MQQLVFQSVDSGSLSPLRDITTLIDVSESAELTYDIDSDVACSGSFSFAGNSTLLAQLVRIVLVRDDGSTEPLGTFFADITDSSRVGVLVRGKVELEGVLAALRDTCAPTAYVVPGGTSAVAVIRDVCAQVGRPTAIPDDLSGGSYAECIIYEAGTPWLTVAQEAAGRCGMLLTQDRMGFIVLREQGADTREWTLAPGATSMTSLISKEISNSGEPTRVVATWSNADNALCAVADAPVRGAHPRDFHLSVSDIENPSVSVLTALAEQELEAQSGQTAEWKLEMLYEPVEVGATADITDLVDPSRLVGTITSITFSLLPVLTMQLTIRGEVA